MASTHYFPLDLEYTVSCIIIVMKIGEGDKKQYWTITEMAELSGYDAMTLRYYERIGIIEPVSRVNGRRAYCIQGVVLRNGAQGRPSIVGNL